MTTRAPGRKDGFLGSCVVVAVLASLAQAVQAAPPTFTGGSVTAPIPDVGESVIINLRQQQVLSGSAPIQLSVSGLAINGEFNPGELDADSFNGTEAFGAVCLEIFNNDYTPSPSDVLTINLIAFNASEQSASATLTLMDGQAPTIDPQNPQQVATCSDPNSAPVANAGNDRSVPDTDGQAGEDVTLTATATDPEGEALTYEWFAGEVTGGVATFAASAPIATGPNATVRLPDGANTITLQVTDEGGAIGTDQVVITVTPSQGPVANAGADRTIADSDGEAGESVTLDGTQSSDSDGEISAYAWFRQTGAEAEEALGAGPTLTVELPDGANTIRLQVTDNVGNTASDTATITVGAAPEPDVLEEIPNLTPQQRATAQAVDRICASLFEMQKAGSPLTSDQQDLLARCNGLLLDNSTENQVEALDEMTGDDFAVARTQTLVFTNTQYSNVMDRLMALRGGASGLSLAGLNIIVDGKMIPLAQLQEMVKGLLGGGASADEPGGLLSDKWGLWARGNYGFGEKDRTAAAPSFDADQWSVTGGIDYRLSSRSVIGGSLAYGQSSVEFNPDGEGGLDTQSWAASLYGSLYAAKSFYFDGIINVSDVGYDARRNITYVDGSGLVTADAKGDTDGITYSGGLSGGYDFLVGGLTLSPNIGFFYIDATIDSFAETGAGGLNLLYDEQSFKSLTANLGLRATYAWNLSWGVLLPHVRADYVREFEDDVDVFGVRFAADPNATSAPPILVETDNPDQSYWRLAAGFSAQFKYGISGYIEYQRLESFDFISFQDVSIGLRVQRSF